jgi:drug/metabolite transporter (DMT)-like permease
VITGTLFALTAGCMWGLVFVGPLLLPDYPPAMHTFGRYLAFGLICLPLAWLDRARLRQLTRADWVEALKLALIGNIAYYFFLSSAIQRAGAPLPTVVIGTLPVAIAVVSNWRAAQPVPWARLLPSISLIAAGIALVNQVELTALRADAQADLGRYAWGGVLAVGAVVCWTWYPIRNAEWLRAHADRSDQKIAGTWATAQGIATLPLALLGFLGFWLWSTVSGSAFDMPLGPRPAAYLGLMFALGFLASWLGSLCWNEASQRLPSTLSGQLIVFETLAALCFTFALRGAWPQWQTLMGASLLVAGVVWALRAQRA